MGFGIGKRVFGIVVLLVLWAGVSCAESRIWTSKKGDAIEAEYVKMFAGKVVLKTNDGKMLKVPVDGLCAADREYLAAVIPPKIEISVDVDVGSESDYSSYDYDRKSESIKCLAVLKKTNKEPCNRKFTAHIYVFARKEKGDTRWLVSCVKKPVSFADVNVARFTTPVARVEYTKSYSGSRGFRYEGYLVVVVDDDTGQIAAIKSNQGKYEKSWSKIKDASKGAQFDRSFDLMDGKRTSSWGTY